MSSLSLRTTSSPVESPRDTSFYSDRDRVTEATSSVFENTKIFEPRYPPALRGMISLELATEIFDQHRQKGDSYEKALIKVSSFLTQDQQKLFNPLGE